MANPTLYERLGGRDAIATVVDEFYDRVLSDERLIHFFEDASMAELRAHQTRFLSSVAGGPVEYSIEDIVAAHAPYDIDDTDYTLVAAHLENALAACDVPPVDRRAVVETVENLRKPLIES